MTCGHCGAAVPEDAERCPKCLRKSLVVASAPPEEEKKKKAELPAALRILKKIGITILVLTLAMILMWILILALGKLVIREL